MKTAVVLRLQLERDNPDDIVGTRDRMPVDGDDHVTAGLQFLEPEHVDEARAARAGARPPRGCSSLTSTINAPWSTLYPSARASEGVMLSVVIPT